jgi:spore germination protein GerM
MRRALTTILVTAGLLSGCGVQPDSVPRDLPDAEQALESSTGSSNTAASGADRIYLIAPGEDRLLRSVQRDAVSAPDLVRILLRGPTDTEIEAQFNTAIPSTTELISARTQGQILTVNLTPDIIELDTQSLVRAIAQIVYTATELDGIEAVQVEIDGEPLSVPTPSGTATNVPLRIYDFPNTVQTSQPAYPAAAVTATA